MGDLGNPPSESGPNRHFRFSWWDEHKYEHGNLRINIFFALVHDGTHHNLSTAIRVRASALPPNPHPHPHPTVSDSPQPPTRLVSDRPMTVNVCPCLVLDCTWTAQVVWRLMDGPAVLTSAVYSGGRPVYSRNCPQQGLPPIRARIFTNICEYLRIRGEPVIPNISE